MYSARLIYPKGPQPSTANGATLTRRRMPINKSGIADLVRIGMFAAKFGHIQTASGPEWGRKSCAKRPESSRLTVSSWIWQMAWLNELASALKLLLGSCQKTELLCPVLSFRLVWPNNLGKFSGRPRFLTWATSMAFFVLL